MNMYGRIKKKKLRVYDILITYLVKITFFRKKHKFITLISRTTNNHILFTDFISGLNPLH